MAKKHLTPRQKRRRARRQYRRTPFKPLGNQFPTWGDLEDRAGALASTEYQPKLNDLRYQTGRETRSHKGRLSDIGTAYKAADTRSGKAYNHLQSSLANLIAARSKMSAAALGAMQGQTGDVTADSAALGVGAPTTADFGAITAAGDKSGADAVTQNVAQLLQGAGAQRGLIGLEGMQQGSREQALHRGAMTELGDRKRDIKDLIPAIIAKYRTQLEEGEASKANTRFQHRIAREQLEDVDKDRKLRKKELDLQRITNNRNFKLQQQQLDAEIAAAEQAGNPDRVENLKDKADRMNNAAAFATEFMAPKGKKEENKPNRIKQNRNPDQLLRALMTQFGLNRVVAGSIVRVYWGGYAAPGTPGRKRWMKKRKPPVDDPHSLGDDIDRIVNGP